jgi:2-amino-4-hydroxy-6-hydroxymethyldihydropteridine diphosphokinase
MHDVFIGIGSNLGDRLAYLDFAVTRLSELSEGRIVCSPVFETAPVGYTDQPDFLNMVARVYLPYRPLELLTILMDIEAACHRQRTVRFGPRTLDLDILLYDDEYVCYQSLQIPHPRMWQRNFVMVPLATLVPKRRVLGGYTVEELSQKLSLEGDVRYVGRFW